MRHLLAAVVLVAVLPSTAARAQTSPGPEPTYPADVLVEAEAGPTYLARNDGRYGPNGTLYTAGAVGQQENLVVSGRLALELGVGRSTFIVLWAPLDVTTRKVLDQEIVFKDLTMPAGTLIDHRYKFEGFRGSWLYDVYRGDLFELDLGASLQIRNAVVAFTVLPGSDYAEETDIGLVFALKGRLWIHPWENGPWGLAEADGFSTFGLGNVTGAIYDVALTLGVPVGPPLDVIFRLRLIGGGADVPNRDIYNWGDFVAATGGIRLNLNALWGGEA